MAYLIFGKDNMSKIKSLAKIQETIINFQKERGWYGQFVPGDNAKSLIIEAAELLEHFQLDGGLPKEEQFKLAKEKGFDIGEELSDILWFLLIVAEAADVDIVEAFNNKLAKSAKKYPARNIGIDELWDIKKKHRANKAKAG